jgi:hypothetical protein
MDFSGENLKGKKVDFLESESSSNIQLLLVPGVFNTEIWKHQIKYFSRKYNVSTFESPGESFEDDYHTIESILDQREMRNTVLISSNLGNTIVQRAERHDNVVGSILTGTLNGNPRKFPRAVYNLFWRAGFSHPKMAKKMFFSEKSRYETSREFVRDVRKPDYNRFMSYVKNYRLRKPAQDTLVINSDRDRFSSNDIARELKPEAKISTIRNSGTFSYYEKPEEYNKAVHDFLRRIEDFVESKKVRKTREKNHTLADFSDSENSSLKEFDIEDSDQRQPVLKQ